MADEISSQGVARDQLRTVVERIQRVDEDIKALQDDRKDIVAEAVGNGFDGPTLKKVVALLKLDASKRDEAEAMLDLYKSALNMLPSGGDA